MAKNEFMIQRTAFGNVTMPSNAAGATSNVLAQAVSGVIIPKGAIVTGIRYFTGGAVTNGSNFKNGTINVIVGGQVVGTNNVILSNVILQTVVGSQAANGSGVYITDGGTVGVQFASSDSARTGVAFDADIYIDYLYCADRDIA